MRRFLAWLCSLSLIFCVVSGVALGVEIPNIEDMDIDPWADFEMVKDAMMAPARGEDDTYVIDDDTGIMLTSDVTNPSWCIRLSGFAAYGTDEDDDDWDGVSVLDTVTYPVSSGANLGSGTLSSPKPSGNRSAPIISKVPCSILPYWVGRPNIVSGDPYISLYTSVRFNGGQIIFDVADWVEVPSCSSLQIMDAAFNISWQYLRIDNTDASSVDPFWVDGITTDMVTSVHLIINGKDVGEIPCEKINSRVAQTFTTRVSISDALMEFDSQLVRSVSFSFNVSQASVRSTYSCSGGYGIQLLTASGGNISDTFRLYSGVAQGEENTGLLKSIIQFLQNIVTGITELPGKIVSALIEGLKSLFIPDQAFLLQWKEDFFSLLKDRLGFIYQCFELLGNFFDSFIKGWGDSENYTFKFPTIEFTIEGTTYTVIQEQVISLDNAVMDVLRPFAGTVVSIVTVLAFIHTMEDMFIAIISGWSYFSYLNRRNDSVGEEEQS